jgi:hypothetical protein
LPAARGASFPLRDQRSSQDQAAGCAGPGAAPHRATEPAIHASRYTVTPIGARFAPRFCYGHREVSQIVSSTPPAQADGFVETKVTFTYTVKDVPVWAKSAAVLAAFPAMAQATANGGTASRTLAQTMAGWQVPE